MMCDFLGFLIRNRVMSCASAWTVEAAVRTSPMTFSLHGLVRLRCAGVLPVLAEDNTTRVRCGIRSPTMLGKPTLTYWASLADARGMAAERPLAATVVSWALVCTVEHALPDAPSLRAYFHMPEHNASAHVPLPPMRTRSPQRHACSLRVCTKAYGTGGALSSAEYTREWLENARKVGVTEVVVNALEPLPPHVVRALRASELVTLRQWRTAPFSREAREAQQDGVSTGVGSNPGVAGAPYPACC